MTIFYFAVGITLSLLIGIFAVRHEGRKSVTERATAKLPYLKFIRFISSWKFFFALLIPSIAIDYYFYGGQTELFFWFITLYVFFIMPLSYSYYRAPYFKKLDIFHSAGKRRLEAYGSDDLKKIEDQGKRDRLRYVLILLVIALVFVYGFLTGRIGV